MNESDQLIAACGLDCTECDIRRATDNPELAHKIADWFKEHQAIEMNPQDVRCLGCKGDRAQHWSADCWILECCVDKNALQFCYQCQGLPCDKLNEWAEEEKRYEEALSRLKEMKRRADYGEDDEGSSLSVLQTQCKGGNRDI
jgi:hypothetical protein